MPVLFADLRPSVWLTSVGFSGPIAVEFTEFSWRQSMTASQSPSPQAAEKGHGAVGGDPRLRPPPQRPEAGAWPPPRPDAPVRSSSMVRFIEPVPEGNLVHLPGPTLRGVRRMARISFTKRGGSKPQDLADAVQERLDVTLERLARAREAGLAATRDGERLRRILDPFDTMRANRLLAPHDPQLNDIRWLIGKSLRRTNHIALGSTPCAPSRPTGSARPFSARRPGLPQLEAALHARDKLRRAEERVGSDAWPTVPRIIIEGAGVWDCRGFIRELATPLRADAAGSEHKEPSAVARIEAKRSASTFIVSNLADRRARTGGKSHQAAHARRGLS